MTEKSYLGEFEHVVLLAILRLGDEAYGVPIRREIEGQTDRAVARGALYTTLDRMETKGYLSSTVGDPTPRRGGRARRYFTITAQGFAALRASREALLSMWSGYESVIENAK